MARTYTLDLNFKQTPGLIAAYLLPHDGGAVLVECGPGSTRSALEAGLAAHGFTPEDVTDLFVTHIHLDHAGASGWLARRGARVHVHHRGLPHLADPAKLLASAGRIYGDQMDALWGEMLPVPEASLHALEDGDQVDFGSFSVRAVDTPGHATHHMALLVDDLCFSGDVGGIRLDGKPYLLLPMPPPEFHLERWKASADRLAALDITSIAPTHFGIYSDADVHLAMLKEALDEVGIWLEQVMPGVESLEQVEAETARWMAARAERFSLSKEQFDKYELSNPSVTSAGGIFRYWRKYRSEGARA